VNSTHNGGDMDVNEQRIWSGSDFPYQCLVDAARTEAFRAAILATVRPVDGVLDARTRMIPARYQTHVALGSADFDHFGFCILMPQHRWPHQAHAHTGWSPARFDAATEPLLLASLDFSAPLATDVNKVISFMPSSDGEVNAIRITGCAQLTDAASLGATNAFNGDKIVPIKPTRLYRGQPARASICFTLGAGFSSLRVEVSCDADLAAPLFV
jgi:hypothetical protein